MSNRLALTLFIGFGLAEAPLSTAQNVAPTIEITECVVYSPLDQTMRFDCSAKARTLCGAGAHCEISIGLALTDGRELDGNPKNWKKVRIRYRCGQALHTSGPFDQDDHATMVLSCTG